ncbi:stage III sporulation protein AA [Halobacillus litoralis]|uniref:stage III sporulation protein AA n=1 Tax=Halobacillus litoralis TaxID=45668 RepID=UPI001CD2DCA8|nr:stage III sporulation protein AA [Halobacillus litoralis]MCA0970118.1 stage III sporulation protein AA [Halobacillus litoralis]
MREIIRLFPEPFQLRLKQEVDWNKVQELRVRVNQPIEVLDRHQHRSLGSQLVEPKDVTYMLNQISQFSLYRFKDELREGFITVEGGHRVGLAGKANTVNEEVETLKHISFMNIRVARSTTGQAEQLLPYLMEEGRWCSTLLIGPPHSGKTTLLRGLAKSISTPQDGRQASKVAIVDERSELAASLRGVPQLDVGRRTDVMDACPKAEGMMMMIRSMSPEVLIVDEIGSEEDARAIHEATLTGVEVICSVHGDRLEKVKKRPSVEKLVREQIFERFIVLHRIRPGQAGTIRILNARGEMMAECKGGLDPGAVGRGSYHFNRYNMDRV